ncbi:MAG: M23 family metallopeptidase [Spirochaetaceae bacterium]|jgi:murein DD-endopeptidase MepM/ murein hydrolase activator NlpD|nr:M23 family metallopeptidase [Spirochaetaceae bacterium]
MKKRGAFWVGVFLTALSSLGAENAESNFPVINRLDVRDLAFNQYMADVENARRRVANRNRTGEDAASLAEALTVYAYTPDKNDDIFSLAARCNIPYAALATLNRIAHPRSLTETLLLPSIPGIFIPENPESDLERLLSSSREERAGIPITINRGGEKAAFLFIPGVDFSPTERIFFLNFNFSFPLRTYRLTSAFGLRRNPITGTVKIHEGLDLAAPEGTEVFATRDGVVTDLGEDPIYGKYIVIQHGENWASLYGHLSAILTTLRSPVRTGALIGRVGSTGQSTGPHLHFELRQNGQAQDPGKLLFRDNPR